MKRIWIYYTDVDKWLRVEHANFVAFLAKGGRLYRLNSRYIGGLIINTARQPEGAITEIVDPIYTDIRYPMLWLNTKNNERAKKIFIEYYRALLSDTITTADELKEAIELLHDWPCT